MLRVYLTTVVSLCNLQAENAANFLLTLKLLENIVVELPLRFI